MRSTRLFFLLLIALFQISCHPARHGPGTLVIGIEGEPVDLDPAYATDAYSTQIARLCFEGLMRFDEHGVLVPDLARSVTIVDDTHIVFTLKKGITFQDGSPFTAGDVAATLYRIIRSKTFSPYREALSHIKDVTVRGPHTIGIELKQPYAPILTALTIGIIPHRLAGKSALSVRELIGTGPYRLTGFKRSDSVTLEAYRDYRKKPPAIGHVVFRIIPNDLTRVLELEKGSVDLLVDSVPPDSVRSLMRDPDIRVMTGQGNNYEYLGFNLRDPVLRNKMVRRAIAHAIDRRDIITYVLFGQAGPAAGILPPWNRAYNAKVRQYAYDPARAMRLLDLAGFPEKHGYRFTIDYKTSDNPLSITVAQAIAYQLGQVGIKVNLRSYEWATFYNDVRHGNFQMYSLRWVGVMDPDILYYAFDSHAVPPYGANRGYYANPEVDGLLERAQSMLDINKALPLYLRVQDIVAEDLPYVSLWYMNDIAAMRRRVRGFRLTPGGGFTGIEDAHLEK